MFCPKNDRYIPEEVLVFLLFTIFDTPFPKMFPSVLCHSRRLSFYPPILKLRKCQL